MSYKSCHIISTPGGCSDKPGVHQVQQHRYDLPATDPSIGVKQAVVRVIAIHRKAAA